MNFFGGIGVLYDIGKGKQSTQFAESPLLMSDETRTNRLDFVVVDLGSLSRILYRYSR